MAIVKLSKSHLRECHTSEKPISSYISLTPPMVIMGMAVDKKLSFLLLLNKSLKSSTMSISFFLYPDRSLTDQTNSLPWMSRSE